MYTSFGTAIGGLGVSVSLEAGGGEGGVEGGGTLLLVDTRQNTKPIITSAPTPTGTAILIIYTIHKQEVEKLRKD